MVRVEEILEKLINLGMRTDKKTLKRVYLAWSSGSVIDVPFSELSSFIVLHKQILGFLKTAIKKLREKKWSGLFVITGDSESGKSQFCKFLYHEIRKLGESIPIFINAKTLLTETMASAIRARIQEEKIISKKPLVIIVDNVDVLILFEDMREKLIDFLNFSQKLLKGNVSDIASYQPVCLVYVMSIGAWIRLNEYIQRNRIWPNFALKTTTLVQIRWSLKDLENALLDLIPKVLAILYTLGKNNIITLSYEKILRHLKIIREYIITVSKLKLQDRKITSLAGLIKATLDESIFIINHLLVPETRLYGRKAHKQIIEKFIRYVEKAGKVHWEHAIDNVIFSMRINLAEVNTHTNTDCVFRITIDCCLTFPAKRFFKIHTKFLIIPKLMKKTEELLGLMNQNYDLVILINEIYDNGSKVTIIRDTPPIFVISLPYKLVKFFLILDDEGIKRLLDDILHVKNKLQNTLIVLALIKIAETLFSKKGIPWKLVINLLALSWLMSIRLYGKRTISEKNLLFSFQTCMLPIIKALKKDIKETISILLAGALSRLIREHLIEQVMPDVYSINVNKLNMDFLYLMSKTLTQEILMRLKIMV